MSETPVQGFYEGGRLSGMRFCYFRSGSAELLREHKDYIDNHFVKEMKAYPNAWIDFIGYTGFSGSLQGNIAMSRRRMEAVERHIKSKYPGIRVNVRMVSDVRAKIEEGWSRAVLIRWYGVPVPLKPPPIYSPQVAEASAIKFLTKKAPPGCWCIIGVDSFGIPIKAGISGGKVSVTLLNDKGERQVINGLGAGFGIGVDVNPIADAQKEASIVTKGINLIAKSVFEMGIKPGDLQNVSDTIQDLKIVGPNETAGGIFRGRHWSANLTIQEIAGGHTFAIASGEGQFVIAGGEVGLINFGILGMGGIWGYYLGAGLSTFKAGLGASVNRYIITSVESKAPLPTNELGTAKDLY
ncbi:MAG: hypothetical protein WKF92_09900 [Pyrinomonadaceae bacterium]